MHIDVVVAFDPLLVREFAELVEARSNKLCA
jgi:hypothetical protein